jgi:DNA helicase HerA-like ATPase
MSQAGLGPDTAVAPSAPAALGRVISVRGSHTDVGLPSASPFEAEDKRVTVGKFIGMRTGKSLLVGVITDVSLQVQATATEPTGATIAHLDIVGEIVDHGAPSARFQRGVTTYPAIGDAAGLIGPTELALIFNRSGRAAIEIGHLQQDASIGAYVNASDVLSKHFAVLGTTGVGKSSGVALILQQMLSARPDLRMFVLDAHNEYGRCFGERALVLNPGNVKLPFWMFNFEEIVDVIFGGRPGLQDEVDILSEVIPMAKVAYTQYRASTDRGTARRVDPKSAGFTVDSPVPYRVADLLSLLDARMGKLENRSLRLTFNRLITRIETVFNDPRYAFMFENANVGGDTMAEVFSHIFRLPPNGVPMTIMQLAGFPAEVVDAVVSVLCRMAFDFALWSDGAAPLLVVCEEAHRYVAADRNVGFGPTRRSISRIAKEGRKYGVFLGLVTQRPAELDPTILSQCSTLFAMRMTNDRDQAILKSAVTDAAANLLAFLPSLGTGEVLAFGEGVALPTRLKFKLLPPHLLPRSEAVKDGRMELDPAIDQAFVAAVLDRWRGASVGQRMTDEGPMARSLVEHELAPPTAPTLGLDPDRFKLLKKTPGGSL